MMWECGLDSCNSGDSELNSLSHWKIYLNLLVQVAVHKNAVCYLNGLKNAELINKLLKCYCSYISELQVLLSARTYERMT
jgi:hypothetical protein